MLVTMPRKCKHKRFRLGEMDNDSDCAGQFKIGSKNVQRWMKIKQKFGFNSDIDFAEYLLSLAEDKHADDYELQTITQPMTPPPDGEIPSSENNTNANVDADTAKCEPFMSLLLECDEH